MQRRHLLLAPFAATLLPARGFANEQVAALLHEGGVVIAFRHALAPGTFDPPDFKRGDCSTQRNLNDAGRAQALRIGQWLAERKLVPSAVRSSPWCRCVDTAQLAFGRVAPWDALGSPRGASESTNVQSMRQLGEAVRAAGRQPGQFEAWVTHQFVLSALVGRGASSGEGLVLRAGADPVRPEVLASLMIS